MKSRRALPFARGEDQIRQRIVQEAARLMAEDGVRDFALAKRKAAQRLNHSDNRHLPSNREIEEALADYLKLFHASTLQRDLRDQLEAARDALRMLADFEPRLTGPLLNGLATAWAEIPLQAFADQTERVALFLREHGIPFEESGRRVRYGGDRQETATVLCFIAGEMPIEITVLPRLALREAPLGPVDGLPMKRADLREIEQRLTNLAAR
jgi:hypothetical protein